VLRGQLNALGAGRGSVVLVTGPAGSGKTTLLAEAASLAADGGILVFCGGADPAARAVPLGAILDALVSTDDPPVDPARLRELSQSPDQRFWLLRELQESLEKAAHRCLLSSMTCNGPTPPPPAPWSRCPGGWPHTGSAGCWRCAAGSWRRYRRVRQALAVPQHPRQRPAGQPGGRARRYPAADRGKHADRRVRPASLGQHPQLGRDRPTMRSRRRRRSSWHAARTPR